MASRNSYLDHLASVPLFAACSQKELQKIAKAVDESHVDAGRVLIEQGDTGQECFIVLDGTAAVKRNNRTFTKAGPGDCIGELALLDRGPRTATVVAETPMDLLVIGPRQFSGVLDEVPSLARKLMATLASRIRDLDSKTYG